jgi:peptide/nickel transport system substrate-binding protein
MIPTSFSIGTSSGIPGTGAESTIRSLENLYSRQARAIDPAERKTAIIELQKRVLENAYYLPGLWWTRRVVHSTKVKNYVAPPNHYSNQKLQDVWLSED